MGPREQSVASGSTITLRCVILSPYQTRPIRGVQWLRDNKLLTFQVMHSSASSRETDSNEIFYTESSSLFRPSTTNSRESLQRKKHDHKSSCRCRDDNRSSYSTPFPYFPRFFFARIEFHFLPCGEVLMKSRYQKKEKEKKYRYLNKNKNKKKKRIESFHRGKYRIEKQRTRVSRLR